jgi:hypothetical protein
MHITVLSSLIAPQDGSAILTPPIKVGPTAVRTDFSETFRRTGPEPKTTPGQELAAEPAEVLPEETPEETNDAAVDESDSRQEAPESDPHQRPEPYPASDRIENRPRPSNASQTGQDDYQTRAEPQGKITNTDRRLDLDEIAPSAAVTVRSKPTHQTVTSAFVNGIAHQGSNLPVADMNPGGHAGVALSPLESAPSGYRSEGAASRLLHPGKVVPPRLMQDIQQDAAQTWRVETKRVETQERIPTNGLQERFNPKAGIVNPSPTRAASMTPPPLASIPIGNPVAGLVSGRYQTTEEDRSGRASNMKQDVLQTPRVEAVGHVLKGGLQKRMDPTADSVKPTAPASFATPPLSGPQNQKRMDPTADSMKPTAPASFATTPLSAPQNQKQLASLAPDSAGPPARIIPTEVIAQPVQRTVPDHPVKPTKADLTHHVAQSQASALPIAGEQPTDEIRQKGRIAPHGVERDVLAPSRPASIGMEHPAHAPKREISPSDIRPVPKSGVAHDLAFTNPKGRGVESQTRYIDVRASDPPAPDFVRQQPMSAGAAQYFQPEAKPVLVTRSDPATIPLTDAVEEFSWDVRPAAPSTSTQPQMLAARPEMPAHLAQHLAQAMHRTPDRPLEIALNPAELGRVRMTLAATEAGIVVTILADRPDTLDLMRRNINDLGQSFSELGYEDIAFAFGQNDDPSDASSDPRSDDPDALALDLDGSAPAAQDTIDPPRLAVLADGVDLRL